jgi:hypothetical protein
MDGAAGPDAAARLAAIPAPMADKGTVAEPRGAGELPLLEESLEN